jgi:hypothetical protein
MVFDQMTWSLSFRQKTKIKNGSKIFQGLKNVKKHNLPLRHPEHFKEIGNHSPRPAGLALPENRAGQIVRKKTFYKLL